MVARNPTLGRRFGWAIPSWFTSTDICLADAQLFWPGILSERMVHLAKLGVELDNIQKLETTQGIQNSELLYRVKFLTAELSRLRTAGVPGRCIE